MQAVTPTPLARIYRGPGRLAESGNSTLTEHQRRVHFWRELFNHAFQRRHPVAETREVSDSRSVSPFLREASAPGFRPKKHHFPLITQAFIWTKLHHLCYDSAQRSYAPPRAPARAARFSRPRAQTSERRITNKYIYSTRVNKQHQWDETPRAYRC